MPAPRLGSRCRTIAGHRARAGRLLQGRTSSAGRRVIRPPGAILRRASTFRGNGTGNWFCRPPGAEPGADQSGRRGEGLLQRSVATTDLGAAERRLLHRSGRLHGRSGDDAGFLRGRPLGTALRDAVRGSRERRRDRRRGLRCSLGLQRRAPRRRRWVVGETHRRRLGGGAAVGVDRSGEASRGGAGQPSTTLATTVPASTSTTSTTQRTPRARPYPRVYDYETTVPHARDPNDDEPGHNERRPVPREPRTLTTTRCRHHHDLTDGAADDDHDEHTTTLPLPRHHQQHTNDQHHDDTHDQLDDPTTLPGDDDPRRPVPPPRTTMPATTTTRRPPRPRPPRRPRPPPPRRRTTDDSAGDATTTTMAEARPPEAHRHCGEPPRRVRRGLDQSARRRWRARTGGARMTAAYPGYGGLQWLASVPCGDGHLEAVPVRAADGPNLAPRARRRRRPAREVRPVAG